MYDPLRHWGATTGEPMTIGVIGIGGLGSIGIKLAKALGHHVVAISTSAHKKEMALQKGADEFIVSTDPESMASCREKIDLILNTASAPHQVSLYLPLLANEGTIVQLGLIADTHDVNHMDLLKRRKSISASHIGGIKATEECLELCAKHGILPDIEVVKAEQLDWVYEQLDKNKDGVRYVIDVKASA